MIRRIFRGNKTKLWIEKLVYDYDFSIQDTNKFIINE